MKTSDTVSAIQSAIVAAQASGLMAIATRENTALSSGSRKAKYADFADVVFAIMPKLGAQSLGFMQSIGLVRADEHDNTRHWVTVTTRVIHVSGEFIEDCGEFPMAPPNRPLNVSQAHGLTTGYAKRLALQAIFGIPSGDEHDAEQLSNLMDDRGGAPQYDEPEATWWSFVGFWQDHDAPGYEPARTLGDLTPDERKAVQRSHYKTNPGVCASLWDDAENALNGANLSYADVLKQWPDDPVVRNLPAAPADMKPAEVGKFMAWVVANISPVTK